MRKLPNKLRPQLSPESRFEIDSILAVPFRGAAETDLGQFKDRLLSRLLRQASDAELTSALRHAANDAAALAWTTPFPLLFLPALVEEKAQTAMRHARHQAKVKRLRFAKTEQAA